MKDDSDTTLQCFSIHVTFKCFMCMFTGSRNISAIQFHGFIFVDKGLPGYLFFLPGLFVLSAWSIFMFKSFYICNLNTERVLNTETFPRPICIEHSL